ncbi:MAG TPA: hypothetical protein VFM02_01465 [Candidatus Paceibacterota bacterium]|nr:hypothetical protein [Candidatus Paceibacterota bacterium]
MDKQEIREKVLRAIENFPRETGNAKLAKIILEQVGIKGATVYFTGGDESGEIIVVAS